jgi:hypothetical protein
MPQECYRWAILAEQTFEGRRENLTQASKMSRTHAALVEALNRHRGKGQQKVTVEHVHAHAGGQAVVGNVEAGGGAKTKLEEQYCAKKLAHAPEPCGAKTRTRTLCQSPSMKKQSMPDAQWD